MRPEDSKIIQAKRQLRETMQQHLEFVSEKAMKAASRAICQQIANHPIMLEQARCIAVFSAFRKEIDLKSLHELLPNHTLVYPLCQPERTLTFHHVASPSTLVSGHYGILEPVEHLHREVTLEGLELILCPGLAFDRNGNRLGYGAGFYDRVLSKKKLATPVWGVCLNSQIVKEAPYSIHDQPVNCLITESELIRI